MNSWEAFYGPNEAYARELYERYLADPQSVDAETRASFDAMDSSAGSRPAVGTLAPPTPPPAPARSNGRTVASNGATVASGMPSSTEVARVVAAARLARSIREYGHLSAQIDPLGAPRPGDPMLDPRTHGISDEDLTHLPASIVWPAAGPEFGTCLQAISRLRDIYSGSLGYEFDHVQDFEERSWLHAVVENDSFRQPFSAEGQLALLRRLTQVDAFERFLHTTFQGQKRFSLEGTDALVPMLDEIVADAEETGIGEVAIGMAHRGRLAVLAHVLDKPLAAIFREFQTAARKEPQAPGEGDWIAQQAGGDVKYHRGAHRTAQADSSAGLEITLADNPSHLEFVNPVVQGFARAAEDDRSRPGAPRQDVDRALAITIHGDAAFPGEGVVPETLNLSALPGYRTGGTLHIIVNNQIGFTTNTAEGRSTLYASDLAKGFEIPIVHVNADDPEACLTAVKLAYAYRSRFHKDFLIDLVGYRRWGHNEGDEPAYTQPRMYAAIHDHPRVRAIYAQRLVDAGVLSPEDAATMEQEATEALRAARDAGEGATVSTPQDEPPAMEAPASVDTAVSADELRAINQALLERPPGFTPNAKLERVLLRRRDALDQPHAIDWGLAEALAFGSILAGGTPIRLSGQDAQRGTFSQRHLVLHDVETGREYIPLQALPHAQASFAVYNSPLTETAVMGFEYGYSVHAPETLVLWEAQYGDFANAGQVVIDQFLAAARAKWQRQPSLVLLLPHGYEGGGPEHSSARLERYLQLAAGDNLRVTNPSTAAQYFHLLRLQAASLKREPRPLVVMTPKSLLRRPEAGSSLDDLAAGHFQTVLDDTAASGRREAVERLLLCSGKVSIDLLNTAQAQPVDWIAVARIEQLYPFPSDDLSAVMAGYPHLREVVWVQEEPANMGAWTFVEPRLRALLPADVTLCSIDRPARASTAAGSPDVHEWEQARIVHQAFGGERAARIETQGADDGE